MAHRSSSSAARSRGPTTRTPPRARSPRRSDLSPTRPTQLRARWRLAKADIDRQKAFRRVWGMKISKMLATAAIIALAAPLAVAATAPNPLAWQNKALSADARANLLVGAMTLDEKLLVVTSY